MTERFINVIAKPHIMFNCNYGEWWIMRHRGCDETGLMATAITFEDAAGYAAYKRKETLDAIASNRQKREARRKRQSAAQTDGMPTWAYTVGQDSKGNPMLGYPWNKVNPPAGHWTEVTEQFGTGSLDDE